MHCLKVQHNLTMNDIAVCANTVTIEHVSEFVEKSSYLMLTMEIFVATSVNPRKFRSIWVKVDDREGGHYDPYHIIHQELLIGV